MSNNTAYTARLSRRLQMTPVAPSEGDPNNRLAFPMDRDVVWDTPNGERTADRGDVRIRENTPPRPARQGMLFAPQSISEYRNTPERLSAVERLGRMGIDHGGSMYAPDPDEYEDGDVPEDDSRFRKSIKNTMKNSRMPTELLEHLPYVEMNYGDDLHFPNGEDDNAGFYRSSDQMIALNHNSIDPGSHDFKNTLLHELGHAVDNSVNVPMDRYGRSRRSNIEVNPNKPNPDPRLEGAAVGFADRYGIDSEKYSGRTSKDPTLEVNYHAFTNSDWAHNRGTDIYTKMRRHTRDTGAMPKVGEVDFLTEGHPHHMSKQFYQPTLWDD